mgnify:CR=1 FL=1
MKKLLTLLFVTTSLTFAYSGEFEKDLEPFNNIVVAGNFEVYLTKGDKEHVKVVNTDAELLDEEVEFIQKGSELKITTKGNSLRKLALKIHLTYTSVTEIDCRNGGWLETKNPLEGEQIELHCTTDGVIHAQLACKNVEASILTGGTIRLSGEVEIADYKVNAGGFISGKEVVAKVVNAKVATGGDISCHGTEKMELKVSTGGNIKYIFDGELSNFKEKVTLGGNITKFGD